MKDIDITKIIDEGSKNFEDLNELIHNLMYEKDLLKKLEIKTHIFDLLTNSQVLSNRFIKSLFK